MQRAASLIVALALSGAALPAATPANYQFITQIQVPGDSGWDYLSIDDAARRLYITHGDRIDVLDIDHNKLVGTITDTAGVHGFAIAHALQRGFASDGQS